VKIRFKHTGKLLSYLVRGIASTLDIQVEDRAGVLNSQPRKPLIWAFWHNRLFLIPYVNERWQPHIPGAILTSPSADGQIIADLCAEFGFEAARGSSSKPEKGMSALIKLADRIKAGFDIGITPDGPRGPRYVLGPGLLKLAQLTGAGIMPITVEYESAWTFPTWDRFMVPKPWSKLRITLEPVSYVQRKLTEEEFSLALAELQQRMQTPPGL
jgi:Kdo2-lipid IVA 3' secondary acyltransferase